MKISDILQFLSEIEMDYTFRGDETGTVDGFSSLKNYREGSFTWVKKAALIPETLDCGHVALVFVQQGIHTEFANVIETPHSRKAFFATLNHFFSNHEEKTGIGEYTVISPSVKLAADVYIGNHCTLEGDVSIGTGCVIGDNVTIKGPACIGEYCEIRSGVRMGYADSIAYEKNANGERESIQHFGGIVIGDHVLIGENSCICRGTIDNTTIGNQVRVDALTHISHNCVIHDRAVLVAGCKLFGSVDVGENAYMVAAVVRNQCRIGAEAFVGMGSVVIGDIPAGITVVGNPARPLQKQS